MYYNPNQRFFLILFAVLFFGGCKKTEPTATNQPLNTSTLSEFSSISPLKADLGDTLVIRGVRLLKEVYNIKFDTYYGNIIFFSDTVVKVVIPQTLPRVNPYIIAEFANSTRRDTLTKSFSLNTPVISSFPATAKFGDTITIQGDHFNNFGGGYQNVIIFYPQNDMAIYRQGAIEYSRTKLKVMVPQNVCCGLLSTSAFISVTAQEQTVKSTTTINLTF